MVNALSQSNLYLGNNFLGIGVSSTPLTCGQEKPRVKPPTSEIMANLLQLSYSFLQVQHRTKKIKKTHLPNSKTSDPAGGENVVIVLHQTSSRSCSSNYFSICNVNVSKYAVLQITVAVMQPPVGQQSHLFQTQQSLSQS